MMGSRLIKSPRVKRGPKCWEWQGAKNRKGYGAVSRKKYWPEQYAHRVVYVQEKGPIPKGYQVMHKCDNPGCVRPGHLQVGTNQENQLDSVVKKRHWKSRNTHCPQGHLYAGKNLYVDKRGFRYCNTCRRVTTRTYKMSEEFKEKRKLAYLQNKAKGAST